ncbi:MAG: hypothetical protein MHM6MM_005299 [Cercozoa sp. M6MM]
MPKPTETHSQHAVFAAEETDKLVHALRRVLAKVRSKVTDLSHEQSDLRRRVDGIELSEETKSRPTEPVSTQTEAAKAGDETAEQETAQAPAPQEKGLSLSATSEIAETARSAKSSGSESIETKVQKEELLEEQLNTLNSAIADLRQTQSELRTQILQVQVIASKPQLTQTVPSTEMQSTESNTSVSSTSFHKEQRLELNKVFERLAAIEEQLTRTSEGGVSVSRSSGRSIATTSEIARFEREAAANEVEQRLTTMEESLQQQDATLAEVVQQVSSIAKKQAEIAATVESEIRMPPPRVELDTPSSRKLYDVQTHMSVEKLTARVRALEEQSLRLTALAQTQPTVQMADVASQSSVLTAKTVPVDETVSKSASSEELTTEEAETAEEKQPKTAAPLLPLAPAEGLTLRLQADLQHFIESHTADFLQLQRTLKEEFQQLQQQLDNKVDVDVLANFARNMEVQSRSVQSEEAQSQSPEESAELVDQAVSATFPTTSQAAQTVSRVVPMDEAATVEVVTAETVSFVTETPAAEAPAAETPVEVLETPVIEEPVAEEPVAEGPVVEVGALVVENPEETLTETTLAEEAPVCETPGVEAPAVASPAVVEAPVAEPEVESERFQPAEPTMTRPTAPVAAVTTYSPATRMPLSSSGTEMTLTAISEEETQARFDSNVSRAATATAAAAAAAVETGSDRPVTRSRSTHSSTRSLQSLTQLVLSDAERSRSASHERIELRARIAHIEDQIAKIGSLLTKKDRLIGDLHSRLGSLETAGAAHATEETGEVVSPDEGHEATAESKVTGISSSPTSPFSSAGTASSSKLPDHVSVLEPSNSRSSESLLVKETSDTHIGEASTSIKLRRDLTVLREFVLRLKERQEQIKRKLVSSTIENTSVPVESEQQQSEVIVRLNKATQKNAADIERLVQLLFDQQAILTGKLFAFKCLSCDRTIPKLSSEPGEFVPSGYLPSSYTSASLHSGGVYGSACRSEHALRPNQHLTSTIPSVPPVRLPKLS